MYSLHVQYTDQYRYCFKNIVAFRLSGPISKHINIDTKTTTQSTFRSAHEHEESGDCVNSLHAPMRKIVD